MLSLSQLALTVILAAPSLFPVAFHVVVLDVPKAIFARSCIAVSAGLRLIKLLENIISAEHPNASWPPIMAIVAVTLKYMLTFLMLLLEGNIMLTFVSAGLI